MNSMRKIVITSIATVGTVFSVASLAAEVAPPKVVVSYSDLDASTDLGAKMLYARLRSAARNVCAAYEGDSLHSKNLWNNCQSSALTNAVADLELNKVSELHARATGKTLTVAGSINGGTVAASIP